MPLTVPLPQSLQRLLGANTHPGLLLDKYVASWDPTAPPGKLSERVQKPAVKAVVDLSQQPPNVDFDAVLRRRAQVLASLGAASWRATTAGPLTLHLARAGALENAGICLHPLYGFPYLPGTGLKGMARAYAETVWLPGQEGQPAAWRKIEDVFGWAPNRDRQKQIRDPAHPAALRHEGDDPKTPEVAAAVGQVVFHDAWPVRWPGLVEDIVNNHHRQYYGAAPGDNANAPGDWEEPSMVSFLAVPPGVPFEFALSLRRPAEDARLVELAHLWLLGGLVDLGAGAKTAAGYGSFRPTTDALKAPESAASLASSSATLELVTPAFLAGAAQEQADCVLRPATLRGLLRWWWRTLHAGFVDVGTLRRLEAAVWGNTHAGGAIRLTLEPLEIAGPFSFDRKFVVAANKLPKPPNNKTAQGLTYHSYGMDETKGRRCFLAPGSRWRIRLTARGSHYQPAAGEKDTVAAPRLSAQQVLEQAQAALWLLCHFGGVGSKARKGFGSFKDPAELSALNLEKCTELAAAFRKDCRLENKPFDANLAESPAWAQQIPFADIPTNWTNYWVALDQLGDAVQRFAQAMKHDLEKKGLGLPRNVKPPTKNSFKPGAPVAKSGRHSGPVWFHLAADASATLRVRVTVFPARQLPDLTKSRALLQRLLTHLDADLKARVAVHGGKKSLPAANATSPTPQVGAALSQATAGGKPKANDRVAAVIVEDPKKKDRIFARHIASGLVGPIQNSPDMPASSRALGQEVTLIVASLSFDGKQIAFRWPKEGR
jgi:CRISPR-associated protein Cmr6